ncbi:MAG: type II toxin-antitoxin system RatA family toxin [Methylococcales symbiont of Hymedesmia sp. n. MRB-2018]|nr:MAG: type II toxin-antitoxin system RatA family toxin [Methylococcales symbiont of Hymedesmia sp. n. MRB-2018]KAF3984049.1 MAG: type II toxin-antitoxin system RatA family toxin [Methylococcales symbiont of Hymedesmia sp. n. MRB-2018]
MPTIKKSALIKFSSQQMKALVEDIESYPEFLPWCSGSTILKKEGNIVEAELQIAKAGFNKSFATRNRHDGEGKLFMTLLNGPFSSLDGVWHFIPLREDASKICLDLDFEIQGKLANLAFGSVFNQICNTMVSSFTERAKQIYG